MLPTPSGLFVSLAFAHVAGAAAGDLTVTGIKLGDKLICVMRIDAAGANLVSEFTVKADNTINNTGGTSTAGQTVMVIWEKFNGGREPARYSTGRSSY